MIAEYLFPLSSSGQSIVDADPWRDYISECTSFIIADSDSTNGSMKINAARSSGELTSLLRAAVEAGGCLSGRS